MAEQKSSPGCKIAACSCSGSLIFVVGFFLLFAVAFFATRQGEPSLFTGGGGGLSGVPEPYRTIFTNAGNKFEAPPALVTAIFAAGEHQGIYETGKWPDDPNVFANQVSAAGATGPFQFMPGTWSGRGSSGFETDPNKINSQGGYGVDGDGDGKADVHNLTDSAFAAAKMLAANMQAAQGTQEEKIKAAIFRYNHSQSYVNRVYEAYLYYLGPVAGGERVACSNTVGLLQTYVSPNETSFDLDPNGRQAQLVQGQLVNIDFMNHSVPVHQKVKTQFEKVVSDIKSSGTSYQFRLVGTYAWRYVRGSTSTPSNHSFGIAMDINWDTNPLGSSRTDIPQNVIHVFENNGFYWGGNYQSRPDPMHFEYCSR